MEQMRLAKYEGDQDQVLVSDLESRLPSLTHKDPALMEAIFMAAHNDQSGVFKDFADADR
jgi:hypothetical protein